MNPATAMMTRPCTVRHVTWDEPDAFGDRQRTVETVETVCELQQSRSTENRDGALVVVSEWNLYLPPGVPLAAEDEVDVDGHTFAIEGLPWAVRDPLSGEGSHIEARARVVS